MLFSYAKIVPTDIGFTWNFFGEVSRGTKLVNKCSLQETCQVLVTNGYINNLTNEKIYEWEMGGGGEIT